MIVFSLVLLSAVEFTPVPASITETVDGATAMKRMIRISGFEISRQEITQREYSEIMGVNPSSHLGPQLPVENVSWFDAIRFANAFSKKRGVEACYDLATGRRIRPNCTGYRLPTDAEWFRAYRTREDPNNLTLANLGLEQTTSPAALEGLSTRPVEQSVHGARDLVGNVWEWCEDWFRPVASPWPLDNPAGALRGLSRVIRGGSYVTSRGAFSRALRSSMDPSAKSRYTGFRLVRRTGGLPPLPPFTADALQAPPQRTDLEPIPVVKAAPSRQKWFTAMGQPRGLSRKGPPNTRFVQAIQDPYFEGKLMEFESEPGIWEKFSVIDGAPGARGTRPVVIVPYYDVDTPVGMDLGGRGFNSIPAVWFARHAAQMGYIAIGVRWFGESDGERYDEVVLNLHKRRPGVTAIGKWVWDFQRLLDYVVTIPGVDAKRIAMVGHSLGGKLSLYGTAMDPRVSAVVMSEPGISFHFSNYQDYWYWGDKLPTAYDQQELLALIAPRPVLLIAGEEADGDKSWPFLESVRGLFAGPTDLMWINHRSGHTPTAEAVGRAMEWLRWKFEK